MHNAPVTPPADSGLGWPVSPQVERDDVSRETLPPEGEPTGLGWPE